MYINEGTMYVELNDGSTKPTLPTSKSAIKKQFIKQNRQAYKKIKQLKYKVKALEQDKADIMRELEIVMDSKNDKKKYEEIKKEETQKAIPKVGWMGASIFNINENP